MISALFVNRGLIAAALIVAIIGGGAWYISGLRTAVYDLERRLEEETRRADAAETGAEELARKAERLMESRDRAQSGYLDALRRIEGAEDACLDTALPPALRDD